MSDFGLFQRSYPRPRVSDLLRYYICIFPDVQECPVLLQEILSVLVKGGPSGGQISAIGVIHPFDQILIAGIGMEEIPGRKYFEACLINVMYTVTFFEPV